MLAHIEATLNSTDCVSDLFDFDDERFWRRGDAMMDSDANALAFDAGLLETRNGDEWPEPGRNRAGAEPGGGSSQLLLYSRLMGSQEACRS